jgi:hypothetical protein
MTDNRPNLAQRLRLGGWWVIAPTLIIIGLMLALTGSSSASTYNQLRNQPNVALSQQEQTPLCQTCHPNEYAAWQGTPHAKASMDPTFQAQLAKSADKKACLTCHTTGFDNTSGKPMAEGVSCEACHGTYQKGHPNAATMQLPLASDTCKVCHESTFKQWETSQHGAKNIQCFDCHLAHNQGLRTGSVQTLCASCHNDKQTQMTHATHGINGVDCVSCHMSKSSMSSMSGMDIQAANHSFKVSSDVCAGCHQSTIHTSNTIASLHETSNGTADPKQLTAKANQVPALEQQITELEQKIASVRNLGVASSGLSLGFGGFLGLIFGIVGATIWQKRG